MKGVVVIEGHVQGLANTRALGEAGIPVIVVDKGSCIGRYSKYCLKFYQCPDYLSNDFIAFLLDLARKENLEGWSLLPSNDHALHNISRNKAALTQCYKVITEDYETIQNIYNKENLLKLARINHIPVPESWFPVTYGELDSFTLKFPLLIKGKFGLTFYKTLKKKAFLVNSSEQFSAVVNSIKNIFPADNLFIQELLPVENNKTISFAAFSVNGEMKTFWMGAKIREHPVSFGTGTYSKSVYEAALIPVSGNLLRALKYTGVCEIEFLFDPRDGNYKLIELNARTWLWVDLAISCGVNFPIYVYNYLNEIKVQYPASYDLKKEWMHYATDIPFGLAGLLKGKYSLGGLLRSYLRKPNPAVLRSSDLLPSLAELVHLPVRALTR